jgi:hypothetical protein
VDVVQTFAHEDGDKLLESFRSRHKGSSRRGSARGPGGPGLYANVNFAVWDGGAAAGAVGARGQAAGAVVERA